MFDLLVLIAMVGAALAGYRIGLVGRLFAWAGLAAGFVVGAVAVAPVVDALGPAADPTVATLVGLGVLAGAALVGQWLGARLGGHARSLVRSEDARMWDRFGGGVAGVVGVLVVVWLLAPVVADVPGGPSRAVRGSVIARSLGHSLPEPPDATRALRQVLGPGYPQVFSGPGRSPTVGTAPEGSGLDPGTIETVARSVVKIVADACGEVHEGTGFVVDDGLVVTNAHVVAGDGSPRVHRDDGASTVGRLVAFDPRRDVAVLNAPGLDRPALPLGEAGAGAVGAVFGHPLGGPLALSPFRVEQVVPAVGTDIYGRSRVRREVLVMASDLQPGDSGSPAVGPTGDVAGMAFAVAPDRDGVAYALSNSEVEAVLATVTGSPADAGGCTG